MDNSKNRPNDTLGVNKLGKNIRKSPLHQPNFANNAARQQPQPQVYNISKNDFRNIVQQLTGSPSRDPLPRPPPQNPPKPQSSRLQKIRPPPLTPINRPLIHQHQQVPVQVPAQAPMPPPVQNQGPYNNNYARSAQYGQPPPGMMQPGVHGESGCANTAESPVSAYMRYLQTSIMDPSPMGGQVQHGQPQGHPPSSGLLPNPHMPPFPSPRGFNGPPPYMPGLSSPRMTGPGPVQPMPNMPSPRFNGPPALLPSPTSQFLLPSPNGYPNMLSPRSPYPLLSPGIQFPPMTPNFPFSPWGQSGLLGPGPQPPLSPGLVFPQSPSGFFPISSPRWRDH